MLPLTRRVLPLILSLLLSLGVVALVAPTARAADPTPPGHLVISAVFGSDGGAYNSDWVQLYNPTDAPISLGTINGSTVTPNYYQCYRSINGTSCSTSMKLYGTVLPHHYFLIWDGHNAGSTAVPPAGATPDLNFALNSANTAGSSADPSGQSNNGFGGYSTGGQIVLLNAASGGAFTVTGDLASPAAQAAGAVDAVSWTKYSSSTVTQAGSAEGGAGNSASAGTTNKYVSARTFVNGVPQDTDNNAADFTATLTYALTSQTSSRVAVAHVDDATIARNGAMTPIQVQGSNGIGTLSYSATGLPTGIAIDPATGVVSGTATAAGGDYPVTVTVADQTPGTPDTATTAFTLTVVDAVVIDKIADVTLRKGDALTPIQVQASGGTPPYAYAATGLPAGTSIDAGTGVISGTPTTGAGRRAVHVTVTDSGAGTHQLTSAVDFAIAELPATTTPTAADPLAGVRINEVAATGATANDFVELVNTGATLIGASVDLVDASGATYALPAQDLAAGGFAVVDGAALHAAGLDLDANDTLYLAEPGDDVLLDQTSWTTFQTTSWARYPDGTGDFARSSQATRGTANSAPFGAETSHLVISQVNGDQSGVYNANWVELYNPTDHAISLGSIDTSTTPATVTPAYYLCYASVAGSTCTSPYKLYGTVLAHHHFLIDLYEAGGALPALPTGVKPDLTFATTDATLNPSGQVAKNIGGYSTGGQLLLLDASADSTGVYPSAANDKPANDPHYNDPGHVTWSWSSTNHDLADPAINPTPVVDAMGFDPNGSGTVVGAEGWKGAADCTGSNSATCTHSAPVQDAAHWDVRRFIGGFPQDTNDNYADFAVSQADPTSQVSSRVTAGPVEDATLLIGAPMNKITVPAAKGIAPYHVTATGLPAGLSIDAGTGAITGTPTGADGEADVVTVTVADATPGTPDTATTSFTLTLTAKPTPLTVAPVADAHANRGAAMAPITVRPTGGTQPYAFSATGLPAGVSINSSTGVVSGTPTAAVGSYAVTVTVADSGATYGDAQSQQVSFKLAVLPDTGSGPAAGDPLAGLRINEVKATGTPATTWVELYNSGAAITGASVRLLDDAGVSYPLPAQSIAAGGYVVVEGSDLHAAGVDLTAADTVYLTETDGSTLLDRTTFTSFPPTSWARTTDGAGDFGVSAFATKGAANSGAPVIKPNDLLVSEVNYDNNSTDYYEYSEVTNTTDHPIDFDAYGLTVTKSGAVMTLHDPADTSGASPLVDPVIPAHGTLVMWWDENQYLGVKTTSQFRSNYGIAASTPVVLVQGFTSLANSGGDHSYYLSVNQGSSPISQAWVDTPCAANTLNGSSVCTATNGNYAEHYEVPADRTNPVAAVWYNSLHAGGDTINYSLTKALSTPGTIDLEQVGFTRDVTITPATDTITLHNTASATADLSGYVLRKNRAGATYTLPAGTTLAAGADLVVPASASGLSIGSEDYASLFAPVGYAYTDGVGIADTTGPFLYSLSYDATSGEPPVIDPTTGLPLPPAGGLYRPAGLSAHDGRLYVSNTGDNLVASLANGSNTVIAGSLSGYGELGNEGPATDAQLYQPGGTAQDAVGDLYIADSGDNVVRVITTDGVIHRFAGTGDAGAGTVTASSTATSVALNHPGDVAVGSDGSVYIADTNNNRVLKVSPTGAVTVVAGTGRAGYSGDGHAGSAATLTIPTSVALDAQDDVYIADAGNNLVRRVDAATGVITTVAGNYAAARTSDGLGGYAGDGGPATKARLNDPQGVALDGAGNLFIADTFNNAVRQVTPDGTITTLVNDGAAAGAENTSPTGSGALPTSTHLNTPYAVAVDTVTNVVYVADTRNNTVAEVIHAARSGSAAGPTEPADQLALQVRYEDDLATLAADRLTLEVDQAALADAQSVIPDDEAAVTAAQADLTAAQADLTAAQADLTTAQQALATAKAKLTKARSALGKATTALQQSKTALTRSRATLARATTTLHRQQRQLATAQRQLRHAHGHHRSTLRKKVARLKRAVRSTRAAVARDHRAVSSAQQRVTAAQRTVTADQRAVSSAQAGVTAAQQKVTAAQGPVADAQAAVTTAQQAVDAAQAQLSADQDAVTAATAAVAADQDAVTADEAAVAADLADLAAMAGRAGRSTNQQHTTKGNRA